VRLREGRGLGTRGGGVFLGKGGGWGGGWGGTILTTKRRTGIGEYTRLDARNMGAEKKIKCGGSNAILNMKGITCKKRTGRSGGSRVAKKVDSL